MPRSYKLGLLDDVTPGMVLSDNLLDRHGKILLPQGTELTEKLLDSLRRYEMDMVPVYCDELSDLEKEARIAERHARLNTLFRKHNYDDSAENANDILLQYLMNFRQGDE